MRNKSIEYPHPVLNEYSQDYLNSRFSIDVLSHEDDGADITIEVICKIECNGLVQTVKNGAAKPILRLTCHKTSYRDVFELNLSEPTMIKIDKNRIADSLDMQALIVATKEIERFKLPEFNLSYFGENAFKIRKGDILAEEPGLKVKLNIKLEKNMSGIVLVRGDNNAGSMSVHFAEVDEQSPDLTDYIVVTLPVRDYEVYAKLMTKKHFKNGVERFMQASLILPVIAEAIGKLRYEESVLSDGDDTDTHYNGTIWADSIYAALKKYNITDLSGCRKSDCEIANILLGNVSSDSINSLMQKLTEWSTIREEDPTL